MTGEPSDVSLICADVLDGLDQVENGTCNLVMSSPPYNIGKPYERDLPRTLDEYLEWQEAVVRKVSEKVAIDGSICWQVGTHVYQGEVYPLDVMFIPMFRKLGFCLRNRVIWRYNFGLNANRRLSGRYETVLWFSRPGDYKFNLDPIRVPQLYPGKRHSSRKASEKAGKPSGNPAGKNPSDYWDFSASTEFVNDPVWEIPNVKANHVERSNHPCQFPVELAERCILAFTCKNDLVLDPFVGTGASMIAAAMHNRRGVGIDRCQSYLDEARHRRYLLAEGKLLVRPSGRRPAEPSKTHKVAQRPSEWLTEPTGAAPGGEFGEDTEKAVA